MKIAIAILLALVCAHSGWSWMTDLDANREPQRRLCGWKLANKLNSVCKGVYNKPGPMSNSLYYRHRRGKTRPYVGGFTASLPQAREALPYPPNPEPSPPSPGQDPRTRPSPTDAFDQAILRNALLSSGVPFPFLTEAQASQVLREAPRRKRGLSAECCRKACSVSELVDYCY
ncbi:LIRP-like [Penaeus monodon]|uniref:LIRP-like n=1 Tax=Penaeus monodon TaxID=6687 RepID=UPI0018A73C68|nr:LIRP-like [Penaeus monodon]XP_037772364.1 LIRP-like [Penaeus monodon]XP_037772365.1 LIRP-like [Penaeus monodon]